MSTDRDDFIIAIRSAFLKKGTQQKFSLFLLIVISIVLLFLETINFKPIEPFRFFTKDIIYRSSFIISMPSKTASSGIQNIRSHIKMYDTYENLKKENLNLKQIENRIAFLEVENSKLKKLINEKAFYGKNSIVSKILIDKQSPYLRSVVLNKGRDSNFKKGMAVQVGYYMIGRITEVNYLSSRVLLISDLNSKIPILIEPNAIQAIMSGAGENNLGKIEFTPKESEIKESSVVYTSGAAGIFREGIPIGKIKKQNNELFIEFFADLTQLDYATVLVGGDKN